LCPHSLRLFDWGQLLPASLDGEMMNIQLNTKRALVTASTGGIGFAIAKGLAEAGASVIINGRSEGSVSAAIARLAVAVPGASVTGVAADLSTPEGVAIVLGEVSGVDILVNNAGIYGPQDFFETSDEVWDNYWQTNVMSGVRLSRALLPSMVEKGWGRVVFVASESARNIPADMIHYGVSKTAQLALARGLAKRVAGSGVTVNSVLPGPTLSDGVADMMQDEVARTGKSLESVAKDFILEHRPSSIIQRAATVEEVANMIVYVCSQQASATTGAALRVDGGVVDDIV
jgi:NAD(P)-dependent dehydrogenase (short-subunit alcohol dehydrogenase family)